MTFIVNWVQRSGHPACRIFPTMKKAQSFYDWFTEEHPELDIKYPLPLDNETSEELILANPC